MFGDLESAGDAAIASEGLSGRSGFDAQHAGGRRGTKQVGDVVYGPEQVRAPLPRAHRAATTRSRQWSASLRAVRPGAPRCPGGQVANGTYYIVNWNSDDVIHIPGSATAQGSVLDQWPLNNGKNQQWKVASLGCGLYSIRSVSDNESLDINGQSTASGGAVDQWNYWARGTAIRHREERRRVLHDFQH